VAGKNRRSLKNTVNRLRLEQLEQREVPAIIQSGLPTWLPSGPTTTTGGQVSGLAGTYTDPVVGAVVEIAPHPTDANILFAAGVGGGVWRTTNAQDTDPTYTPLTDNLPSLSASVMELNPQNPNQLLVGLGDRSAASGGIGIVVGDLVGLLYTENALDPTPTFRVIGGDSGQFTNLDITGVTIRNGYMMVIGKDNDGATTREAVFISKDNGATFQKLDNTGGLPAQPAGGTGYLTVFTDPSNASRVYLGGPQGIFRTDNILAAVPQWTNITDARMGIVAGTQNIKFAVHNSSVNVVYAVVVNRGQPGAVYWSTNFGQTWTQMDIATTPGSPQTITDVNNASPIQITSPGHGLVSGDNVLITGVTGNLEANGLWTITRTANNTFTLNGSISTGVYTGGGVFQKVTGVSPGGQGEIHLSLAADPTNPNIVYLGGDRQEWRGPPTGSGATNYTANIMRGNRATPAGFNSVAPSPQWTWLTDNNSLGSAPHADSREMTFDAAGNLLASDDGGLYKRTAPQTDSVAWVSIIGNLSLGQINAVSYDSLNNVAFGGTQDTGAIEQGLSNGTAGNPIWQTISQGDGGVSAVDNTSTPGISVRYTTGNSLAVTIRREFNAQGVQVGPTHFVQYASITDPTPGKGINDNYGSSFTTKYLLNTVDARLMLLGIDNKVFEDNNPAGFAGDVVADVTPTGLTGTITALSYGGRQSGQNFTRIAYVGTDSGQLFIRGSSNGFYASTVPGAGAIRSVAVDPDNWRIAYVLRGTAEVTLNPATYASTQVYMTTDGGLTYTEITENVYSKTYDGNGNLVGGLSSNIRSLALWDSTPGDLTGGGTVLLAAGVGGVFRYVPSIVDPNSSSGGWTEYGTGMPNAIVEDIEVIGNRLVVSTMGRGVWQIPDVTTTIKAAAQVIIQGDGTDNNFVLGGAGSTPGTIRVSDGQGNTLTVEKSTGATFRFNGGVGADTLTITGTGQQGGDLSSITSEIIADMGNNLGDTIIINNTGRVTATTVTVTGTSVGGGTGDNIFGTGFRSQLTYFGLAQGNLVVDLGTQAVNGNIINVQSSSAATTTLNGTNGGDTFSFNSQAGNSTSAGDLASLFGTINVNGRLAGTNGPNVLSISDIGATTGNTSANIINNQVLGFAGPTDAAVIQYSGMTNLNIVGSNSAALLENFRVENPQAILGLRSNAGADTVNVRAINQAASIDTGIGNDVILVTSTAGDSVDGDLNSILAALKVEAGGDDNQLIISNYTNAFSSVYTITNSTITGATSSPITYSATGGRFFTNTANGLWVRASNTGDDTFNVTSTLVASQTALDGNGGNDGFTVLADSLGTAGNVALRGGQGSDTFSIDSGIFGVRSDSLQLSGGGGGTDRATVLGFNRDDKTVPVINITDTVNGNLAGIGNTIGFDTLTNLDYDGRVGRNSLVYNDATNNAFGNFAVPEAGIVYQPKGRTSGEIRLAGVGPIVNFTNINGADATGLVINGDANGTGAKDTLTVLGVSDNNLGFSGGLTNTVAGNGSDEIIVTDQYVTIRNQTLGDLRSVAPGKTSGKTTLSLLLVKGGQEATFGDNITVTPSGTINIFVDGGAPLRKKNGDQLTVNTAEGRSVQRVNDPAFGPPQTRVVTDSGASFGFTGFENASEARSIFAVGADIGGGPRVRVYDAITKEVLFDQFVYAPAFTGGVRVATGDVTGDGVPDLVVGAGIGGGPHVQVFDGIDFSPVSSFFAYETTFRGGVYLSIGDLTGDGIGDIITGVGNGGGPVVKVFDAKGRALTAFFAYDSKFRGGVRVASGDVNGDGNDDIITGAGVGGGPHVKVFNASDLVILNQFIAGDPNSRDGIFVAAGDLDGDGSADIVVGPGGNSSSQISVRSSMDGGSLVNISVFDIGVISDPDPLVTNNPDTLDATGNQSGELGGIRVAITDLNTDGKKQVVTSRGPGYPSRIRGYTLNPLEETSNQLAFEPEFTGGIFVG
jgi:hypothetical protein